MIEVTMHLTYVQSHVAIVQPHPSPTVTRLLVFALFPRPLLLPFRGLLWGVSSFRRYTNSDGKKVTEILPRQSSEYQKIIQCFNNTPRVRQTSNS